MRGAVKSATRTVVESAPRRKTVTTVLLHVQRDDSLDTRVETALALARACGAHVDCVQVTPYEAYVAFDNFGGVFVMNDVMKALDEEEGELRSQIQDELRNEDVSWDYNHVTGNVARVVAGFAALADIVVTGRTGHSRQFAGSAIGTLGDLLHWSRTPLLLPGDQVQTFDPLGTALIAWDGSFQAANAVRSSIGLLQLASDVKIIRVNESGKDESFPATRLLEFLSRHEIHAEIHIEPKRGRMDHEKVTAVLLAHARAVGAAYLALGAYSHSRFGEFMFGGVTRSILERSDLPIVIAR